MACRGLCEEGRLLPPDQSVLARFRHPRRQQAQADVLRPRRAALRAPPRDRLTTFIEALPGEETGPDNNPRPFSIRNGARRAAAAHTTASTPARTPRPP